jgi:hypothetical protein
MTHSSIFLSVIKHHNQDERGVWVTRVVGNLASVIRNYNLSFWEEIKCVQYLLVVAIE